MLDEKPASRSTSPTTSASPRSGSSPASHGYFAGGAGDERTLRENVAAFARWRAAAAGARRRRRGRDPRPRCSASRVSMPLLVAPVAFQRLVDPDGEVGDGAGRGRGGDGDVPVDARHRAPERGRRRGARRAAAGSSSTASATAGVTAGADRRGGRVRLRGDRADRRRAAGRAGASATCAPASPSRRTSRVPSGRRGGRLRAADQRRRRCFDLVDPTLDWDDARGARRATARCRSLVKGVHDRRGRGAGRRARRRRGDRLQPRRPPARRRRRHRSTSLAEVVDAVDGRVRGADGRRHQARNRRADGAGARGPAPCSPAGAPLWGLAVGGERGRPRVLELLREELELALALCGCAVAAESVSRAHVQRAPDATSVVLGPHGRGL